MTLSSRKVLPTGPLGAKILVVGEAPGEEEDKEGKPFVGRSGDLLWDAFKRYSVTREQVRVTNICNYRPKDNNFILCHGTPQLSEGIGELNSYIKQYRPNVIAAIGSASCLTLTGRYGILAHRSSILPYIEDPTIKVIPAIHPAYLFRTPTNYLFFDFDIRRVIEESTTPDFNLPKRQYIIEDYLTQDHLTHIYSTGEISIDIESALDKESGRIVPISIGFSPNLHLSVVVPWNQHNYGIIKDILEDKTLAKIFHYGYCFDIEVLFLYGINVQGMIHDTYLMAQTLDPGLPRTLAFLTTTHTREPYYKKAGRDSLPEDTKVWGSKTNKSEIYVYNAKDTAVTIEIKGVLSKHLHNEDKYDNYLFKLRCAEKAQIISRNGMLVDDERMKLFEKALVYQWTKLQQVLNMMAGRTVNVNSNMGKNSVSNLLYNEMELPPRRDRKGKLRGDEKALLSLVAYCQGELEKRSTPTSIAQWTIKREIVKTIIDIRGIRKMISSYVSIDISLDGRMRSSYNAGGASTNRWAANKYVDDTGINGMTMPRGDIIVPEDLPEEVNHNEIVKQLRKEMAEEEANDELENAA